MGRSHKALGYLVLLGMVASSCIERKEAVPPPERKTPVKQLTEAEIALAREWILSRISERLQKLLRERVVHITADTALRVYQWTWNEKTPHADISFGGYAVRLPMGEIAGYPWESAEEQVETGHLGPILLKNGWQVWLGYIESADAISRDLSLSVQETCDQLSVSGDAKRDYAVRRLCDDFRRQFVFASDLQLFRRLWHSPFDVEKPMQLRVKEALATLLLADLKRLIAPPTAEGHVAEVSTPWMKGFEFGDGSPRNGFFAELFDQRNHVSVLFLPPMPLGEPLATEFRQKALASVRRLKHWAPGLQMIRKAEEIQQMPDLHNSREVCSLLLFSALQFPDHKDRAAAMLLHLFPESDPQHDTVAAFVNRVLP